MSIDFQIFWIEKFNFYVNKPRLPPKLVIHRIALLLVIVTHCNIVDLGAPPPSLCFNTSRRVTSSTRPPRE
jgi:hypothetical protein